MPLPITFHDTFSYNNIFQLSGKPSFDYLITCTQFSEELPMSTRTQQKFSGPHHCVSQTVQFAHRKIIFKNVIFTKKRRTTPISCHPQNSGTPLNKWWIHTDCIEYVAITYHIYPTWATSCVTWSFWSTDRLKVIRFFPCEKRIVVESRHQMSIHFAKELSYLEMEHQNFHLESSGNGLLSAAP